MAPRSPVCPQMANAASGYEREREARIRENMARMQKLGILDLAQTLRESAAAAASRCSEQSRKPVEPGSFAAPRVQPAAPLPPRRSVRLKDVEEVDYSEQTNKGSKSVKAEFVEEAYTEEHEKLLGTCQTAWTRSVDGYDQDGKRINDPLRGKAFCHQCRRKTPGHHTSCATCKIVQGQFCGQCLYLRYGENVLEAKKNPSWICPVCRDLCNCRRCRIKRGWFPVSNAYGRKAVSLGYKSVAHYLIATKRSCANSDGSISADPLNKLPSDKSKTSSISDHDAPATKESLEDGETSSKAEVEEKKATLKKSDDYKGVSRGDSVVPSDSQAHQVNKNAAGCANPPKPAMSRKRKVIKQGSECVASRLRSHTKS